jgi:hypothetical protein
MSITAITGININGIITSKIKSSGVLSPKTHAIVIIFLNFPIQQ